MKLKTSKIQIIKIFLIIALLTFIILFLKNVIVNASGEKETFDFNTEFKEYSSYGMFCATPYANTPTGTYTLRNTLTFSTGSAYEKDRALAYILYHAATDAEGACKKYPSSGKNIKYGYKGSYSNFQYGNNSWHYTGIHYTKYQYALWHYNNGLDIPGLDGNVSDYGKAFINEVKNKISNQTTSTIKLEFSEKLVDSGEPIKIKELETDKYEEITFTNIPNDKIVTRVEFEVENLKVIDKDGKYETFKSHIEYRQSGNQWVEFYDSNKNSITIDNLQNNTKYYIKRHNENYNIKSIKFYCDYVTKLENIDNKYLAPITISAFEGEVNRIVMNVKNLNTGVIFESHIEVGDSQNNYLAFYENDKKTPINIEEIKSSGTYYVEVLRDDYEVQTVAFRMKGSTSQLKVTVKVWSNGLSGYQDVWQIENFEEISTVNYLSRKVYLKYPTSNLTINKVDKEHPEIKLSGAKMKIQKDGKWLLKTSNNTYSYTTFKEATEFETNEDGKIELKNLENGTYYVFETETPKGYDKTKQEGYDEKNDWVKLGKIEVGSGNNNLTYTFKNVKIVSKLSGRVWIDNPDTKGNSINNVYDSDNESNDKLLGGVKVNLRYGNVEESGSFKSNVLLATTVTNENGYYEFTNAPLTSTGYPNNYLTYTQLSNCFVEFIYNNKTYICVDPFVGSDESKNSKAMEYSMDIKELEDNNLTGTEGDYPGKAVTYYKEGEKLLYYKLLTGNTSRLTDYYNKETNEIENINLGLAEKITPQFAVTEEIAYTKIKYKDNIYKYEYTSENQQIEDTYPTVYEQVSSKTFTGPIYPSDIAAYINNNNNLDVYVVYRIAVKNVTNYHIDNIYDEQKMYISSLTNNFDTDRYELDSTIFSLDDENVSNNFSLWSQTEVGAAKYGLKEDNSVYKNGLESNQTGISYIQFKLKEDAKKKILLKNLTEDDIKSAPSVAYVTAYHEYLRKDNLWKHSDNNQDYSYDGRVDSKKKYGKDTKNYLHKSISETRDSSNLYIRFELPKDESGNVMERTISGTVFEDNNIKTKEVVGNGIKDDNEKSVKGVKVELIDESGNVVDLYQYNVKSENENYAYTKTEASTTTDENGNYSFKGVVPGNYYIRFTYGQGNEVTSKISNADVKINDYKSTIINTDKQGAGNVIKDALDSNDDPNTTWYLSLNGNNYSTAIDNSNNREKMNNYIYKNENDKTVVYQKNGDEEKAIDNPFTTMDAKTPKTQILLEKMASNIIENKFIEETTRDPENEEKLDYYYTVNNGNMLSNFSGFNFGIITQPKTEINIEKKIKNVELVVQNGVSLANVNPANSNSKYVTALDKLTEGSQSVKAEMDKDLIYGTKLATTYEITVKNNSDLDYKGYDYYKYGIVNDKSEQKVTTVEEVVDNLDEKYKDSVEVIADTSAFKSNKEDSVEFSNEKSNTETYDDGTIVTTRELSITGWGEFEENESKSLEYTVTTLLSNDDDLLYINKAKITKVKLDELSTLKSNFEWKKSDAKISIATPTGENRNNLYWIVGTCSLVILGIGIIVLKKKVL